MTTDVEAAQDLYNQLRPAAIRSARGYVMARTPATLQDEMTTIVDADIPPVDPPMVVDAPHVSQTGSGVGSTLNCTLGNWSGTPSSRTYQWKKNGVNIGTNAAAYTLVLGDPGGVFTCTMVATNAVGSSAPVTSNAVTAA